MTDNKTESVLSHVVLSSLPPEPAATQALEFILRDVEARQAFVSLFNLPSMFTDSTRVMSEVALEEDVRPDLVIYDRHNKPRLIVENKFWAGLTDAQPVRYLETLPDDEIESLLVFVVPKTRSLTIWRELKQRCEDAGFNVPHKGVSHSDVVLEKVTKSNRHIGVTSWETVLNTLINVPNVQEDVRQLRALTERMAEEAFLPIHPEELTNVSLARRMVNFANLTDHIVNTLEQDQLTEKDGQKKTFGILFTGTYLRIRKRLEIWLGLEINLWQINGTSPIWCVIDEKELDRLGSAWQSLTDRFPGSLERNTSKCIPLHLKTGVEIDRVVSDAADQLVFIADLILENSPE